MIKKIKIFFLICLTAALSTCTYRANDPAVCYTDTIQPMLTSNCGGCHGAFLTYEGTMNYVVKYHPRSSTLYKYVKGPNPKMPPESHNKLTGQQVYYIKAWISMGAQNTSNCSSCDTSQYKFANNIGPIMNSWCVSCHSAANPGGGFDLSSYNGVANAAVSGKLMGSIKHLAGYSQMPQGGGQLPACEINKIQNWVKAGHPNN